MYILEKTFLNFFQTSLTASIIILTIFLTLKLFEKKISVRIKYTLCILITLRLLVPILPQTDMNIVNIVDNIYENFTKDTNSVENINKSAEIKRNTFEDNNIENKISNNTVNVQNDENKIDIFNEVVYTVSKVWLFGCITLISVFLLCSLRFKFKVNKSRVEANESLQTLENNLIDKLKIQRNIPMYVCKDTNSPCILGILNTKIYIPEDIFKLEDEKNIKYILLHELMHYKRADLWFNVISIIALSIHWYNPLVWVLINKIKLYREYSCDAGVLEFLGEEQSIDYGMTLINYSKIFINKNKYSKLAICFETNKKIGERIKMIKGFKNGSYKISAKAALGCLVAAAVVFTNGVSVRALDASKLSGATSQVQAAAESNNSMIIDSAFKVYNNIEKPVKIAGFNFKLPNYIIDGNSPIRYAVIKLADGSNGVDISFKGDKKAESNYSLFMFKGDSVKTLRQINELDYYSDDQIESNEEEMKFGDVNGKIVTFIVTEPEHDEDGNKVPEEKLTLKYFVWEDNGVSYSIAYDASSKQGDKEETYINISKDEVGKVAGSFESLDKITNVDYKANVNDEEEEITNRMRIYDKEDLDAAKKLLGFSPKIPLKISDKVAVDYCTVSSTADSDEEKNKMYYGMCTVYNYDNEKNRIAFSQSKHDLNDGLKQLKENGYLVEGDKKITVDKIEIDGKVVYKYNNPITFPNGTEPSNYMCYLWEDNGVYYSLGALGVDDNTDDIAKEFVNFKGIK